MKKQDYIDAEFEVIEPAHDAVEPEALDDIEDDFSLRVSYWITGIILTVVVAFTRPHLLAFIHSLHS